jgi:glycosyltransferase involved in cell wall biosynthesis
MGAILRLPGVPVSYDDNRRSPLRIAIAGRAATGEVDGIRDHAHNLAATLRTRAGVAVRMCERRPDGTWSSDDGGEDPDLAGAVQGCDALLLQYNPFLYGRWGVAPWLPAQLRALRRRGVRVAVMVHETAVPLRRMRGTAMGAWQRGQLRAVVACADVALVSIEPWAARIAAFRPRRPVRHLPVGSNLPDMRHMRAVSRARLGLGVDDIAVATLSTGHPSHLVEPVREACNALADSGWNVTLLRLGAGASPVGGLRDSVRVLRPGRQPLAALAVDLAAADLALMPYVDGVSTRRTGLMAALQHGVAVVGSDGPLTDGSLRESGAVSLVANGSAEAMARGAVGLTADPRAQRRLGGAGRRLYDEHFDWSVIAAALLEALQYEERAAPLVRTAR